jgi:hypothetical protein
MARWHGGTAQMRPAPHSRIRISNSRYSFMVSRRYSPEVCSVVSCASIRGRRNAGCALHPRSRVQKKWRTHTSIQVQRRHSDIPCAMALRFTSRSSRRSGLLDTVAFGYGACAPGRAETASEDLTPTMRRQNHATSPYAQRRSSACRRSLTELIPPCHHVSRLTLPRPPHPAPRL